MVKVQIQGGEQLARNLRSLSSRLSTKIQVEALMDGAELIRRTASRLAPREARKPDLAEHINVARVRSLLGEARVGIGVPKRFYYDTMQEFGTIHHGAQPFYRPALDQESERAIHLIAASLWRELAGRGFIRTETSLAPIMGGPGGGLL